MSNLLSEGFKRTFKTMRFWVVLFITIGVSAFYVVMIYRMDKRHENTVDFENMASASNLIFLFLGLQALFMAIVPAMIVIRDFTQNTVRNKIICGHSRTKIYISNLITTSVVSILYHIASMVTIVAIAVPLVGEGDLYTKCSLYYICVSCALILSFNAITVFMSMMVRKTSGAIFAYLIHEVAGIVLALADLIKDEATKRFLYEFLPTGQLSVIQEGMMENKYPPDNTAIILPLYSLAFIVLSTVVGISFFKKADLK